MKQNVRLSSGTQWIAYASKKSKHSRYGSFIFTRAIGVVLLAFFLLLWQILYLSPATVLLSMLLMLSCFNYFVGGEDVLYPAFTFTAIWTVVAAIYLFCPIDIRHIGWKTSAILVGGMTSFSVGSLLGNRPFFGRRKKDNENKKVVCRDNPQVRFALLCYTAMTVPIIIWYDQKVVGVPLSFSPMFFITLRAKLLF